MSINNYCKYCLQDITTSKTRVVCDLCKTDKERRKQMERNLSARLKRAFDKDWKQSILGKKAIEKELL